MPSRRNFLIQGGLATSAMIALKPLNAIAGTSSTLTSLTSSSGKLVFLHTIGNNSAVGNDLVQYVNSVRSANKRTILIKADHAVEEMASLKYDVCISDNGENPGIKGEYKIVTKGNIKTGIISALPTDENVLNKVNSLSAYLKNVKNCAVVVCLSQLGYKNENNTDDVSLAKESSHLDIIISGHADNFHPHPVIALNNRNHEVIIHSAASSPDAIAKIEIDFNEFGDKKLINFSK